MKSVSLILFTKMAFRILCTFAFMLGLFFCPISFHPTVIIILVAYPYPYPYPTIYPGWILYKYIILYYLFSIQTGYLFINLVLFVMKFIVVLVILELIRSFFGWRTLQEDWQLQHQKAKFCDYICGLLWSKKQKSYDTGTCPICMDSDTHRERLYCGHFFCPSCIASWQEKSTKCPVCRHTIEVL